jgi:hypothetical protein
MSRLSADHIKFHYRHGEVMPYGATQTIHFTRRDMLEVYAEAMRIGSGDPTLERRVDYVGEDCVILEWTYVR